MKPTWMLTLAVSGPALLVWSLVGHAAQATAEPPKTRACTAGAKCCPEMVLVRGGEFVRGGKKVRVSAFYMDPHEVTNEDYCRFLKDGNEKHWHENQEIERKDGKFAPKPGKQRWPVYAVSWHNADAYARWAGKRLPTDAEWLWAAVGREGRTYPWGNEPITPEYANYGGNVGHPQPVGSYPKGRSPDGIYDLAGNVAEWCHDWFDPDKGQKIRRSGCFAMKAERQVNAEFGTPGPEYRPKCIGFRCVRSAAEASDPVRTASAKASATPCCMGRQVTEAVAWLEKIGFSKEQIVALPELLERARGRGGNPAAFADLKEGGTVVDLGCGAGVDCLLASKRVGSSGKVIGVDMSPEAIRAAEENRLRIGAGNVEFRKGYLENLPLEDASVDVAISNCVVPVMTLEPTILREVLRVLKPGGQLVFNSSPPRDDLPADVLPGEDRETGYLGRLRAAGFAQVEVGARILPPDPTRSKIMVVARKAADLSPEAAKAVQHLEKIGYSKEDIASVPLSAILGSAGCGNPVAFAGLKGGQTVVDLGCGDGMDCFLAAKRVGTAGKVIGVDMSPKAIAAAQENKRQAGASNVEFRQAFLEHLPLESASVDVAISNCVGPIMWGEEAALREAFRVLKPDGRLVTTTTPFNDDAPAEALSGQGNPLRQKDYFAKLRGAGFAEVEIAARKKLVHRSKLIVVARKGGCCLSSATPKSCPEGRQQQAAPQQGPCCMSPEMAEALRRLEAIGYSKEDIASLPASVILASAGSGNPLAFTDLKEGQTLVDLGCGAGIDCFLAAKRVGSKGKVIGVDKSPKAIAAAEKNKCKTGLENVEFRQGDLEKIPVKDESVDVAISNCVGCVMRGDQAVLREAFRVLKPGGRLVTTGGPEVDPKLRAAGFGLELDLKLRAAGFEVTRSSKGIVTARKPSGGQAGAAGVGLGAEPATERTPVIARFEALRLGALILDPMTAIQGPWTEASKRPSRPPKDYRPVKLDVDGWVAALAKAGVQYAVCTAKELHGFCLWDSKYTDYDVAASDYKTDVLAEFVKACRKHGVAPGFHYCLGSDHYHMRDKGMTEEQYYTFALNQVSELVTQYGPLNRIWWSGSRDTALYAKALQQAYDRVKSAQPDCMMAEHNIRHDGKNFTGWPTDVFQPGQMLPTVMHNPLMEHNGKTYYIPYEVAVPFHLTFGGPAMTNRPVAKVAQRCQDTIQRGASATIYVEVEPDGTLHENQIKRLQELQAALKELLK